MSDSKTTTLNLTRASAYLLENTLRTEDGALAKTGDLIRQNRLRRKLSKVNDFKIAVSWEADQIDFRKLQLPETDTPAVKAKKNEELNTTLEAWGAMALPFEITLSDLEIVRRVVRWIFSNKDKAKVTFRLTDDTENLFMELGLDSEVS